MRLNRDETTLSNKRWTRYIAAAAAGTVAILGTPSSVDADLTWIQLDQTLEDAMPLDGNFSFFGPFSLGAAGASFRLGVAEEIGAGLGVMFVEGLGSLSIAGSVGSIANYVNNLSFCQNVSTAGPAWIPGNPIPPPVDVPAANRGDMAWGNGYANSQFLTAGTGYVGFRFNLGAGTQYGFIEVIMDGAPLNTGTLVGYGYGMPGEQVLAGKRGVIPEPGALGFMALGSVGLLAWRRKRAA